jgi:metallo-beta-lactamase family protein
VVTSTARRRGKVIIPSFAVGRAQELVYALNQLDADGDIPPTPVFVDSPLAVNATDVFRMHPEEWNAEVQQFLVEDRRRSPFDYGQVQYIRDVSDSKRLNHLSTPAIIIAASGMAESGRILHHLKNNIEDADNTILFVSFQAENTLGRRIKDGLSPVRIFGEQYDVRAHVTAIEGYSAHADQAQLLYWAGAFDRQRLQHLFLVHGEPQPASILADKLRQDHTAVVTVPVRGQQVSF